MAEITFTGEIFWQWTTSFLQYRSQEEHIPSFKVTTSPTSPITFEDTRRTFIIFA